MTEFTPRQIVAELDRHIVAQSGAKRAVAVALRNRWRRRRVADHLKAEITPKNILMIGPTGVGKTEIARRLAKLAGAPFIKIEATKFTEVGYVGRDVEQIVRDLVEMALIMVREDKRAAVRARAEAAAEERVLDALVGENASVATRESFRTRLRAGDVDDKEVDIDLPDNTSPFQAFEIPGMPGGSMGMLDLGEMLGKGLGAKTKTRRLRVKDAYAPLVEEECDRLLDETQITAEAIAAVENDGIVFLDEIDKITARSERQGGDVSREGGSA
ncbi:MAG: AAA family ATPase [Robiginitomaculum sp.]|nr:AAA family ATPase [Robiginitomaculum sp.]